MEGACGARLRAMKRVIERITLLLTALMLLSFPVWAEESAPETTEAPTAGPTEIPEPTEVPGPDVRFTRDFSSRYAEQGNQVTVSYTVRNDGALPIEDVVIKDKLVGEVGRIERLEPGERKTMNARVRIRETCTSSPSIAYEYNGQTFRKECASEKIHLAQVKLRVELNADKTNVAPGEVVTLRLSLVNEGNVNLYGLRAEEPVLGEMGSLVSSLPPGEEYVVTRTVPMKSTGTFQFSITGSSDTGDSIAVQSNEMSVIVMPVAAEIRLTLRAEADRTELTGPGKVAFLLYLNNECMLELRHVALLEETRGEIRELVFVPTGEMPPITGEYDVTESGTFRFMAQVSDSVGDRTTVYSEPIEITVLDATQPPEGAIDIVETPGPTPGGVPVLEGAPYRMEENPATFEKLMLGTSLLLLTALMIWNMVVKVKKAIARRRKARRRRLQKKNKRASGKK